MSRVVAVALCGVALFAGLTACGQGKAEVLGALKAVARAGVGKIPGGTIRAVTVTVYRGRSYGTVAYGSTDEEADPDLGMSYLYAYRNGAWEPAPVTVVYNEVSDHDEPFHDLAKASAAWGVPVGRLQGWMARSIGAEVFLAALKAALAARDRRAVRALLSPTIHYTFGSPVKKRGLSDPRDQALAFYRNFWRDVRTLVERGFYATAGSRGRYRLRIDTPKSGLRLGATRHGGTWLIDYLVAGD